MSKNIVPCGGFELDKNFLGINKDGELSLVSGSEGAPYQQLVTDGTGKATWEDRLAYETDPVETEVFPEQTLTDGEYTNGAYWFFVSNFTIVPNLEYTVVFDGVEYKCRSAEFSGKAYIGNATILGLPVEDTGESFFIAMVDDMNVVTTTAGPHTISLSVQKGVYHQLPLDYITNGFVLSGMIEHKSETMTDTEFNAYYNAMRGAFHPILKWRINDYGQALFIDTLGSGSSSGKKYIYFSLLNGEKYKILKNSDGVYDLKDASEGSLFLGALTLGVAEANNVTHSNATLIFESLKPITVRSRTGYVGASTETPLFKVEKNGSTTGQNFEVLGNGTVKAYSVILPSSTEGSTKKFKITVDDTGTISATEVTS